MPKRATTLHHAEDHIVKDTGGNFSQTPPKDVEQSLKQSIETVTSHQGQPQNAHEAAAISTADDGGYFATSSVEGNLQEVGAKLISASYGAHMTNAQTVTGSSNAKLLMDVEDFDIGGYYDPSTDKRWTPPTGTVFIRTNALLTTFVTTNTYNLRITKNGSVIIAQDTFKVAGAFMNGQASAIDRAESGDYYEIFVNNTSAVAIVVNASSTNTNVQGAKIP